MSSIKVDILLPYWGEFELLKKAVDSVLAQTEQDWRLFIVDDCYPKQDAKKTYSNFEDKRVKYHRHEKNMGLVKNYLFALSKASAPHTVIMGCDDIMLPDYLETALSNIGEADYYQPNVQVIDEHDNIYSPMADKIKKLLRPKKQGIYTGEKVTASLCHGNWTYFPSLMWLTKTLKGVGFDERRPNTQDLLTQIDILTNGGSIYIDNKVTFQYRRSAASFSSKAKSGTRFEEEGEVYNQLYEQFKGMGWRKASFASKLHITSRLHKLTS